MTTCTIKSPSTKAMLDIILNKEKLYKGDLLWYAQRLFFDSTGTLNPYHNLPHSLDVLWIFFQAARFHLHRGEITREDVRNGAIACMLHDVDHPGFERDDSLNLKDAVSFLAKHISKVDLPHFNNIAQLMRATQQPRDSSRELGVLEKMIQDADLCPILTDDGIPKIVLGLSAELRKDRIKMLKDQKGFLRGLRFKDPYIRDFLYPKEVIEAKIKECQQLLKVLTTQVTF